MSSGQDPKQGSPESPPGEGKTSGSGEGSGSALLAMLKKRREGGTRDEAQEQERGDDEIAGL